MERPQNRPSVSIPPALPVAPEVASPPTKKKTRAFVGKNSGDLAEAVQKIHVLDRFIHVRPGKKKELLEKRERERLEQIAKNQTDETVAPIVTPPVKGVMKREEVKAWMMVLADALEPPTVTPPEVDHIREALAKLASEPPADKKAFIEAVAKNLEKTGYCIKVHPEGSIARRMYISGPGTLGFQCTDGTTPGLSQRLPSGDLVQRHIEFIPYERPFTRHKKGRQRKPSPGPN